MHAIKVYADPFLPIFQSRPLREREQAPPSSVPFRSGWYRSRPGTSLRSPGAAEQHHRRRRRGCRTIIIGIRPERPSPSVRPRIGISRKRALEKEIGEAPPRFCANPRCCRSTPWLLATARSKSHRKRTGSRRTGFDHGRKSIPSVRSKFDISDLGARELERRNYSVTLSVVRALAV